ncbi:MAG: ATPase domain-containing protein [Myxococcaceae bacterium]
MAGIVEHSACVDAWIDRVPEGLPPKALIEVFEARFGALWRRANPTLGVVTLTAVIERVLHSAAERHPLLSTLKVDSVGLRCDELLARAAGMPRERLLAGFRFVLIEFLTVLGNLTAEILTPALHGELANAASGEAPRATKGAAGSEGTPMKVIGIERIETGVRNLDALLLGGLPKGSVVVLAGPPGAGKTILAQQICFHNASAKQRVLYFNTLSEPTAKTLAYLSRFAYFDARKLDAEISFVDLGVILRTRGLEETSALIMEHVKKLKPAIVVIDSFKALDDLARSKEKLRKFGYEIAVNLMAWGATTFLLGEYGPQDLETNPLFSIADGLVLVTQREQSGEQQRFLQISKMRGTDHSRDAHSFVITSQGIEVFAPGITIKREDRGSSEPRCKTGISQLDDLLGEGIPRGSSLLIAGVAGTGKTALLLEFISRGAQAGERGIIFSFEETKERLLATARGLGLGLDAELERGMAEIIFIPQPDIMVEQHLLMMRERIEATQAKRVAVDSISVFLHKIHDSQIDREKTFQLASIIQNNQAVGFLATDIPYGANQLSRFGVEETVVDGVILLSSTELGLERQRWIEVYKLRNTAHSKGRHSIVIGRGGIRVFPRYDPEDQLVGPPPALELSRRLASGVPGLDELLGGGLLERSVTLVSGSAGIGKSTLSLQFLVEGVKRNEPGLYVTMDEGPAQVLNAAGALGLPVKQATEAGLVEVAYFSRDAMRASQFLAVLTEKIRAREVRRLVIDGASPMLMGPAHEGLLRLLHGLVVRFKALGVTTLLTLESASMRSTEAGDEQALAPVADNLLMLRYAEAQGVWRPTVTIVKTRGSEHDWSTHDYELTRDGIRIGAARGVIRRQ